MEGCAGAALINSMPTQSAGMISVGGLVLIVPMLRVGMPLRTLRVPACYQKNTFTSRLAVFWSVSNEPVSLMPYLLVQ